MKVFLDNLLFIYKYGLLLKSYQFLHEKIKIISQMPINQVFVKIKFFFDGFFFYFFEIKYYLLLNKRFM